MGGSRGGHGECSKALFEAVAQSTQLVNGLVALSDRSASVVSALLKGYYSEFKELEGERASVRKLVVDSVDGKSSLFVRREAWPRGDTRV